MLHIILHFKENHSLHLKLCQAREAPWNNLYRIKFTGYYGNETACKNFISGIFKLA